jgi:hypothetical protein
VPDGARRARVVARVAAWSETEKARRNRYRRAFEVVHLRERLSNWLREMTEEDVRWFRAAGLLHPGVGERAVGM